MRGHSSSHTYTVHILLRRPLDEVEHRQVDARKWLAFYSPFKLGICQSQMEDFQRILHLEISKSYMKKKDPHEETSILDGGKRK